MAGLEEDTPRGGRHLRARPDGTGPADMSGTGSLSAVPVWEDGDAVLTLTGDIDTTTISDLRAAARACVRRSPLCLTLDLSAVTFCDVAGLRALQSVRSEAIAASVSFRLVAPSPYVARIFTLMDAGDLLLAAGDGQPGVSCPPSA